MLPYALAITVGLSSSFLFVTAFFLRDIHRQDDFFWSGVGLFYALVLWFCATSISGAVLLGQLAAVALLTAYFWQTIKLRKAIANPERQENLDKFSVVGFVGGLFKKSQPTPPPVGKTENRENKSVTEKVSEEVTQSTEQTSQVVKDNPTIVATTAPETTVTSEDTLSDRQAPQDSTSEETPSLTNTKLNDLLDAEEAEDTPEKDSAESKSETIQAETSVTETPSTEEDTTPIVETTETAATEQAEIKEIAVETVTIVEEETNWDDDVEDIPSSSVTVIEENVTTVGEESESAVDSPSQTSETEDKPKSEDN